MKHAWQGVWKGEQVYIEVTTASIFEAIAKSAAWGLLGRAKTRSIMLYGRQLVTRRETKESLSGSNPEFDLIGKAKDSEGHEALFHAIVDPSGWSTTCQLTVDDEPVALEDVC